jgi:hypothetical protein
LLFCIRFIALLPLITRGTETPTSLATIYNFFLSLELIELTRFLPLVAEVGLFIEFYLLKLRLDLLAAPVFPVYISIGRPKAAIIVFFLSAAISTLG